MTCLRSWLNYGGIRRELRDQISSRTPCAKPRHHFFPPAERSPLVLTSLSGCACARQLPHIPLIPLLGGLGIVCAEGPSQMASFWGPQSSPTYFELLPPVPSASGAPPADQSAALTFLEASGRTLDAAAKTETVGLDPHLGS